MKRRLPALLRQRRVIVALEILLVALLLGVFAYVLRDVWADALPLVRDADLVDIAIALAVLNVYYLLFVLGWQWILAGMRIRIGYVLALQAEMASMLAKYIPGVVWTPLARIIWLRRAGVRDTPVVFGSIALEGGLSALSGVLVFAVGFAWVGDGPRVFVPLGAFALAVAVLIHPRVFAWLARLIFRRFGGADVPPLTYRRMLALLAFYSGSWLVGGLALFFLVRAVGGDVSLSDVPYLGGTAAVGAIIAVLAVFAPSGLGVREASMYGLLLAVTTPGVALGVTVVNRLAITLVEVLLLALGVAAWNWRRPETEPAPASPPALERD